MGYKLKDVASLAGVSMATASRILNGKPGSRASTRRKVLEIAKQLNYAPDQLAKSIRTKRSYTIGLVVADITNPFYSYTAKKIEMRARANNYTIIVGNTNNNANMEKDIIEKLKARKVDGFIFASVELFDKPAMEVIQEGHPCIMYHRHLEGYKGNFIGCDNYKGVRLAIEHLNSLGHNRIGFISGPRVFSTGTERLKAFLQVAKELAIETPPYLTKEGAYELKKTAKGVHELLELPEPPTAIFAANDLMALQVFDCVLEAGYKVPEDISIVGFDDIGIAAHHAIQLTTVDIHANKCANLVIENILNIIEGARSPYPPIKILLAPSLKIRKTTNTAHRKRY